MMRDIESRRSRVLGRAGEMRRFGEPCDQGEDAGFGFDGVSRGKTARVLTSATGPQDAKIGSVLGKFRQPKHFGDRIFEILPGWLAAFPGQEARLLLRKREDGAWLQF